MAMILSLLVAAVELQADPAGSTDWTLLLDEDFSDDSYKQRWVLEGLADPSIGKEGEASFLRVTTRKSEENPDHKQSVLWHKHPVRGDARFVFRARGETKNRSIFLFNAKPTVESGFKSIFDWARPDSQYVRYAGSETIHMYSVGILRDDQKEDNFRYLGGASVRKVPERKGERLHCPILKSHASPFFGKPDTWFEFDLQVVGRRVRLRVNGELVIDQEDPGRAEDLGTSWTPLTNGGYFGFRNFVPGQVCFDYIKVYKK